MIQYYVCTYIMWNMNILPYTYLLNILNIYFTNIFSYICTSILYSVILIKNIENPSLDIFEIR